MTTLNQELKSKVEEVSRSNSDLQNLMVSTGTQCCQAERERAELMKRIVNMQEDLLRALATVCDHSSDGLGAL